jgi:mRNA-degrading endonuclease YafQ of YafQ-DinJ toxin-antitoxin module
VNEVDKAIILLEYEEEWKDQATNDKAQEFLKRTGHTARATYFNRRKKLMQRMKDHPLVGRWSTKG